MMKLYGALILFLILSTEKYVWPVSASGMRPRSRVPKLSKSPTGQKQDGLRCYQCESSDSESCTKIKTCPDILNRCFSKNETGLITKGCLDSAACISPITCCEGDLCNNVISTGPSIILLLVSSAIITLFL